MLYPAGIEGPFQVPGVYDPDRIATFLIRFKPGVWEADTVYNRTGPEDYDIVVPPVFRGYYHAVLNPGKSHATTAPNFARTIDGLTEDFEAGATEGLIWIAKPYVYLPIDIDITGVTATPNNGVVLLGDASFTTHTVEFTVDAIPADAAARSTKSFQIRFRCPRSDGDREDVTLEFSLAER